MEPESSKGTLIVCQVSSSPSLKMHFVFNALRTGAVKLEPVLVIGSRSLARF